MSDVLTRKLIVDAVRRGDPEAVVVGAECAPPSNARNEALVAFNDLTAAMDVLERPLFATRPPGARARTAADAELRFAVAGCHQWLEGQLLSRAASGHDQRLARAAEHVMSARAHLQRALHEFPVAFPPLVIGPLSIDVQQRVAAVEGTPCGLSRMEVRLVAVLAAHAGRAVTAQEIARVVQHGASAHRRSTLVHHARRKLRLAGGDRPWITTVQRGLAYRFASAAELDSACAQWPDGSSRIVIDHPGVRAWCDSRPLVLERREYELLDHLVEDALRQRPDGELLALWRGDEMTLRSHVSALRRKLGDRSLIGYVDGEYRLRDASVTRP